MHALTLRLNDDDYETLRKLSYDERLPRAEIIRRAIRLEAIHKREEERRQAALGTAQLQKRG
jgi:predicted transcriptional regulator